MKTHDPIAIFSGTVIHGKKLGRTLSLPTANLAVPDIPRLRRGVYAARVLAGGAWRAAVVNIGRHPTAPDGPPSAEAHLLDYAANLYGETITVELTRFLRDERTFDSLEALRAQIARDIEAARTL